MLMMEEEIRNNAIWDAAKEIMLAIRTAPKTRGRDHLTILLADQDHKKQIAAKMDEIFEQSGGTRTTFLRDAKGVMAASALLIVGAKSPVYGLNCAWCGFPSCAEKPNNVPCVFGSIDLGIGSGVASARLADKFIDNRMMYSIGLAAIELNWFAPEVTMAVGFPLSATGKNPFFDR